MAPRKPRTRILQLPPRLASPDDWDAALANLRRLLAGLHAHMAEIEAALVQLEARRQAELAARHAAQSGEARGAERRAVDLRPAYAPSAPVSAARANGPAG